MLNGTTVRMQRIPWSSDKEASSDILGSYRVAREGGT